MKFLSVLVTKPLRGQDWETWGMRLLNRTWSGHVGITGKECCSIHSHKVLRFIRSRGKKQGKAMVLGTGEGSGESLLSRCGFSLML